MADTEQKYGKIKKLQLNGGTVFPATILDAVKDTNSTTSNSKTNPHYKQSLRTIIEELDAKDTTLSSTIGDISELSTKITDKSSLVAAINDVRNSVADNTNFNTLKTTVETLNGDAAKEGSVKKQIKDAVDALDVSEVGGTGKVITTVSEADGKISATAVDLKASNVASTAITASKTQVAVAGTDVQTAIGNLATSIKTVENAAATYSVKKVESGLAENVKEAYQLVQTVNGVTSNIDVQIPVYKDQSLKSVDLVAEKPSDDDSSVTVKGQFLKFTYLVANGDEDVVYVDVSQFLVEAEFTDGLSVTDGKVSVKVDPDSEYLSVGSSGVKVTGIKAALANQKVTINTTARTISQGTNKITVPKDSKINLEATAKTYLLTSGTNDGITLDFKALSTDTVENKAALVTDQAVYNFACTAEDVTDTDDYEDLF